MKYSLIVGGGIALSLATKNYWLKGAGNNQDKSIDVLNSGINETGIMKTDDNLINSAIPIALKTIEKNLQGGNVNAGDGYPAPWLRDTLDLGIIPNMSVDSLKVYLKAIPFWANVQETRKPVYTWGGSGIYDTLEEGQISSNTQSGYYDESMIFIPAVLEAYQTTGDEKYLGVFKNCQAAWDFGNRHVPKDKHMIYAEPLVATDGLDQINRRGFSTNLEGLWYKATVAMSDMEKILGESNKAEFFKEFAEDIKTEMNNELFSVSIPNHRNAPNITKPFGHYIGWKYKLDDDWYIADYFELDSNLRAVLLDIADKDKTISIMNFINDKSRFKYIMGNNNGKPPSTKWIYGDYEPRDYASIHSAIGDGVYQNQYWPSVGSLAAITYKKLGDLDRMNYVFRSIAGAFNPTTGIREWYHNDGSEDGSQWFQWAARTFLLALYKAYCGIEKDGTDLIITPLKGNTIARLTHLGKDVFVKIHESTDHKNKSVNYIDIGDRFYGSRIPKNALKENGTIDVYLG